MKKITSCCHYENTVAQDMKKSRNSSSKIILVVFIILIKLII